MEQGHLGNMSAKRRRYGNLRTKDEGGPKAVGKETCATDEIIGELPKWRVIRPSSKLPRKGKFLITGVLFFRGTVTR